jgi:hypothetical protein
VLSSTIESYFAPEVLSALQSVFDEAWQEIQPAFALTAREAEERRTDLAQMIILAHRSGMPPQRIRDAVLGPSFRTTLLREGQNKGPEQGVQGLRHSTVQRD